MTLEEDVRGLGCTGLPDEVVAAIIPERAGWRIRVSGDMVSRNGRDPSH